MFFNLRIKSIVLKAKDLDCKKLTSSLKKPILEFEKY